MKLTRHEFLKLQKEWYQKLSEHGFEDIEKLNGTELVLIQSAGYAFRRSSSFEIEMKEEYFRRMAQAVYDEETYFRSEGDRFILERHAEGAKIKVIEEQLTEIGLPRERKAIRRTIRRYAVAWGLRKKA